MTIILRAPTGEWLQFATPAKAKAFSVDDNPVFEDIQQLANAFSKTAIEAEILRVTGVKAKYSQNKQDAARKLWVAVEATARDPFNVTDSNGNVAQVKSGPKKANQMFVVVAQEGAEYDKLPKQAKTCLAIIAELADNEGHAIYDRVKSKIEGSGGQLNTKQDPWRIFSYYKGKLISAGLLKITRA